MVVTLSVEDFGRVKNPRSGVLDDVKRFTWRNQAGIAVQVISYGAIISAAEVPDSAGNVKDVVLGFDNVEGFVQEPGPYFGATMGRVANRIAGGKFTLNGETYQLEKNRPNFQLHGGKFGFDRYNWSHEDEVSGNVVKLSLTSPDGDEGYPGEVKVSAAIELLENGSLSFDFRATTTKATLINLANHCYFNLAGHDSGAEELYKHVVKINADKITETDPEQIPTGRFISVASTPYNFKEPVVLGPAIADLDDIHGGFDNNYCINEGPQGQLRFVANVSHPCGRYLEVTSDQPGLQFYTSNNLPDPDEKIFPPNSKIKTSPVKSEPIKGKRGALYKKHGAFCLETQKYPDAVHHDNFPSTILNPGQEYIHRVVYKFGTL